MEATYVPVLRMSSLFELGNPGGLVYEYQGVIVLYNIFNVVAWANDKTIHCLNLDKGVIFAQETLASKTKRGLRQQ